MAAASIVWFRQDLRLEDNPALTAAVNRGRPVIPLFIWSPDEEGDWPPGSASQWWLRESLLRLGESLLALGSRLIIRSGESGEILKALIAETNAEAVLWNRRYEPAIIERDKKIKTELSAIGCKVESFNSALLFEPWTLKTKAGDPYKVFTPFWKAALALNQASTPSGPPLTIAAPPKWPNSLSIDNLFPETNDSKRYSEFWRPGEAGARKSLDKFVNKHLLDYPSARDVPSTIGTSRMSAHLHFGDISPRQIWNRINASAAEQSKPGIFRSSEIYLKEIGWREFAYHLLFHFPQTVDQPLRSEFAKMDWSKDHDALDRWKYGMTGYPLVDAGMRELLATGWMHNRIRMIVSSFLVKDLLLPWQSGAKWFWEKLVDADLANNTLGWQWSAGCGADAAPYFRIFNPVTQSEKFDPNGDYIRKWVPELGSLDNKWIHKPWEAPKAIPDAIYPEPIVDHATARKRALDAFADLKRSR
jgi:deoxyribodipyrimidine photo-lyase